jgi:colanic acid biosynthesis protein WcaH
MALSPEKYMDIVEYSQIVSLDLVLFDEKKNILLGKRKNNPAKDTWFVPGGKIMKGELWYEAVVRISDWEIGFPLEQKKCSFLGINDHIYPSNFQNKKDKHGNVIPTHYLCIAVKAIISREQVKESVFLEQHSELSWMKPEAALQSPNVHEYTKKYLKP